MNSVVWFEMPFDESERAQKFYKDVFGWQINPVPNMRTIFWQTPLKLTCRQCNQKIQVR